MGRSFVKLPIIECLLGRLSKSDLQTPFSDWWQCLNFEVLADPGIRTFWGSHGKMCVIGYGKPDSRGPFANFTRRNSNSIWRIASARLQIPFSNLQSCKSKLVSRVVEIRFANLEIPNSYCKSKLVSRVVKAANSQVKITFLHPLPPQTAVLMTLSLRWVESILEHTFKGTNFPT